MRFARRSWSRFSFKLFYYPFFCVQICVLLRHPSWRNALLAGLALALGDVVALRWFLVFEKFSLKGLLAFLQRFEKCQFESVDVEPFRTWKATDSAAALNGEEIDAVSPLAKGRVRTYVVRPGTSPVRPGQMPSFVFREKGYIFLVDAPTNQSSMGKFKILHELGHMNVISQALIVEYTLPPSSAYLLPWLLLFSPVSWTGYALVILTCLGQFAIRYRWTLSDALYRFRMRLERIADLYALERLSRDDLRNLALAFRKYSLRDTTLGDNPLISEFRNQARLAAIERTLNTGRVPPADESPVQPGARAFILNLLISVLVATAGQQTASWKIWLVAIVLFFEAARSMQLMAETKEQHSAVLQRLERPESIPALKFGATA